MTECTYCGSDLGSYDPVFVERAAALMRMPMRTGTTSAFPWARSATTPACLHTSTTKD